MCESIPEFTMVNGETLISVICDVSVAHFIAFSPPSLLMGVNTSMCFNFNHVRINILRTFYVDVNELVALVPWTVQGTWSCQQMLSHEVERNAGLRCDSSLSKNKYLQEI